MADTNITIKDTSGNLLPVDARTAPDGDLRQVVLLGDGETANLISPATEATLAEVAAQLGGTITVHVDNETAATDVSGLATVAKQDTQATKLDTLHTDLGKIAGPASAVSYGSGTANQAPVAPA